MYFLNYAYLCVYIGFNLYYNLSGSAMPDNLRTINMVVCWAFLAVGIFFSGRIIVDCALLSMKGEMTSVNAWRGVLLALLQFLPSLLMSLFMLRDGFTAK